MDGWMDGIHKKECVGVLIFTCCATVTAGLPRPACPAPSAFLSAQKKERKKKKSEANPPTWHRCKDDDDVYVRKAIAVDSLEPGEFCWHPWAVSLSLIFVGTSLHTVQESANRISFKLDNYG